MTHDEERPTLTWGDMRTAFAVVWERMVRYRWEAFGMFFLAMLSALGNGAMPFVAGRFFDALTEVAETHIITHEATQALGGALIVWFVMQVTANVVDWRLSVRSRLVGTRVFGETNSEWMSKLLYFPIGFHKTERSGSVTNRINQAANYSNRLIETVILNIGPALLSLVVGIGFALYLNATLAVVIVCGMFIYGGITIFTALPLARLQHEGIKAWSDAYGDMHDVMGNIHAVKQSVGEKQASARIREAFMGKAFTLWVQPELIWARISFLQRAAVVTTQLVIFALSILFVARGELSIGGLVALNGYAAMVFAPLAQLASNWNTVQNGLTAVHEAHTMLQTPPERYEPTADTQEPKQWEGSIAFDHVSFAYPDAPERTIVHDVSFTIEPGMTVALVGESGVGKTTTIELISGYYFPTKGEVRVSGISTADLPLRPLREHIAVVSQEPVMFNDTVMKNGTQTPEFERQYFLN